MQELQRGLRVLPARCYCQRLGLTKFRLLVVAAGAHCAQDVNLSAAVLTCLGASEPCPARCPLPAARCPHAPSACSACSAPESPHSPTAALTSERQQRRRC
jgi:hypothetical protein